MCFAAGYLEGIFQQTYELDSPTLSHGELSYIAINLKHAPQWSNLKKL